MTLRYWKKVALCLKLSVWCHILLQRLHNLNIRSHFLEMVSWSAWKSWKPVCWSCTTQVGRKEAPHRPSRSLSEQKTTKQARMPKSRHCLYQTTNRFVSDHWFESDRWSDCGQEKDLLILVIYYSVVSCNERSIQSSKETHVRERNVCSPADATMAYPYFCMMFMTCFLCTHDRLWAARRSEPCERVVLALGVVHEGFDSARLPLRHLYTKYLVNELVVAECDTIRIAWAKVLLFSSIWVSSARSTRNTLEVTGFWKKCTKQLNSTEYPGRS